MKTIAVSTLHDLKKIFPIIKELREHLSFDDFVNLFEEAQSENNYQMLAYIDNDEVVGLMGFRILIDFVHGRHFYIDDLVIKKEKRSQGIGEKILIHAEQLAREYNCNNLRLCTGINNEAGKRFYQRNNWILKAVVYKKHI